MATMLVYFFTNAQLDHAVLQTMLTDAVNVSLNRLSIDSDTSTSDTVALLSIATLPLSPEQTTHFQQALTALCIKLTRDIVSQGEGVTKMIEATVTSPYGLDHAQRLAKQIINSPLIKTTVHGATPNLGRIVMAIGKPMSGHPDPILDRTQVAIRLQGHDVYRRGQVIEVAEPQLLEALRANTTVQIDVTIGEGGTLGRAWGCDLSPAYVMYNAGEKT